MESGCNDGAINLWDLGGWSVRLAHGDTQISWTEEPLTAEVDGNEKIDLIRACKCVDNDHLAVTTQTGYRYPLDFLTVVEFMCIPCPRRNGVYYSWMLPSKIIAWRVHWKVRKGGFVSGIQVALQDLPKSIIRLRYNSVIYSV